MQKPEYLQEDIFFFFRLNKSLYGFKQVPGAWYAKMDVFLLSIGFIRWKHDRNVYLWKHDDILKVIVLYVYDLLITGSCNSSIGSVKESIHIEFSMTDLGLVRQFLGLEIEKSERGIILSQPKYAGDLINKFNMEVCKESNFPFLSSIKIGEFRNSPSVDCTLYP